MAAPGNGKDSVDAVIVGPGAMGCMLAGLLAQAGRDVWLLDKDPERARTIDAQGILLEEDGASRTVRVPCTADPAAVPPAGALFLCVKAHDTAAAAAHARALTNPETTVISLQNGAGNGEIIAGTLPGVPIVCGTTACGSTLTGPGRARLAGRGPTFLAALDPGSAARSEAAAALLESAGLEVRRLDDVQALVWSKLVVNAAINPMTAVLNIPNGQLMMEPRWKETMLAAAGEVASVAHARGISLLFPSAEDEVQRVCRATRDNISSMLQDIRRGRRTEVDAILGIESLRRFNHIFDYANKKLYLKPNRYFENSY